MAISVGLRWGFSQRSIYDARYRSDAYDQRSSVRVLTAEMVLLEKAAQRAILSHLDEADLTVCDFGYGTGRVTNEFLLSFAEVFHESRKNLEVVAYDVSSVGLAKAANLLLTQHGFSEVERLKWSRDAPRGYKAGTLSRRYGAVWVSVHFVHGSEHDTPADMRALLLGANRGRQPLVTTSWYSGLSHTPTQNKRAKYIRELGDLTRATGELILAVAATGDNLDGRLDQETCDGQDVSWMLTSSQDSLYRTEIGQTNYCHLFGEDLNDHMIEITDTAQRWWVEAVRFPDDEFSSLEAEQSNYAQVVRLNGRQLGKTWSATDFGQCHTVAAVCSGSAKSSAQTM